MGNEQTPSPEGIEFVNLKEALEERYLSYALSTIMHRALPDVRDGLKPVHRRLLYAMRQLKLEPGTGFKKSARVVGDVIGKYHPHGDQSVYDALVRLAQAFAVRYPMVDGQGNFGNIDGDNAAAMRYTEARLTEVARLLLEGIDEDAVDFRETYDGEEREPIVLPGAFPNLLANGSAGIAVGMATAIPPHNAAEVCDAALHLIKFPNAGIEKLVSIMPGPDLPTGGIIVDGRDAIIEAYRTGRGGFKQRAKWHVEEQKRGVYQIVVTEIPYQVQKSRMIEKIAELLQAKRLPLLEDVRDESAEDIRLVLEPRSRTVDPNLLMESLFRLSELESRVSLNMNVLSGGLVPKVMGLRDVLQEWLDHRRTVLIRRSNFRLRQIIHRLEVLGGYLVAFLNLDEVIRIIREEDHPKQCLIDTFELTDVQSEAILNMRLRSLRKLEELELRKEFDALTAEQGEIEKLLGSDELQWNTVSWEIKQVRDSFSQGTDLGRRRTEIPTEALQLANVDDIQQAMIEKEPVTVVLSEKGWIRAMKGHIEDTASLTFKTGDGLQKAIKCATTDKILIFTTGGKMFTVGADKLPGGRGHGEPVRIIIDMEADQDVVDLFIHESTRKLLVATVSGRGFVVAESDIAANTRKGKQVLNVAAPDEAALVRAVTGDKIAIIGQNRKLLVFNLDQLPEMSRGKGVRLQRYKDGGIADLTVFSDEAGLVWVDTAGREHRRTMGELTDWLGDRAQAGRIAPQGFPRTNKFGIGGL
jgi:topoisomerase-4 subunit A